MIYSFHFIFVYSASMASCLFANFCSSSFKKILVSFQIILWHHWTLFANFCFLLLRIFYFRFKSFYVIIKLHLATDQGSNMKEKMQPTWTINLFTIDMFQISSICKLIVDNRVDLIVTYSNRIWLGGRRPCQFGQDIQFLSGT